MIEASELALSPLFSGDYMPHGMCYAWEPSILWLSIISDLLIASSYFSIPVAILIFVKKREVSNYRHIYLLFAAFIFFCGLTHLFSIITIFNGYYGYQAILKFATAVISFLTAVGIFKYLPLVFSLPTPTQMLTEQKASAENEMFKQMSLNSPIGLILVNKDFKIQHMNPKACELFEYNEEEFILMPINQLVPDASKNLHIALMKQYVADGKDAYQMNAGRKVEGITRSGGHISVEITISKGQYKNENFIFVSVVDIINTIKSGSLLRSSLMKLDRITEATEDGLWEWNLKTNEVWQSKKHLLMMGYDENTEPGYDMWLNHIYPEDRQRVQEDVKHAVKNKVDFLSEYLGKTKNGKYEWFRSKGKLTFDSEGEPILLSGNFVNINKDVLQKTNLIDKSNHLEKVINRSINCLYTYDFLKMKHTYVNDEYTSITGYTLDDLYVLNMNGGFMSLYHPDELADVLKHIEKVKSSSEGGVYSLQYRFKHKAGHWIWCLSRDSVFDFDDESTAKEMLGTFIDITQIKKSESRQKKLSTDFQSTFEMAAVGVAHVALDGSWIKVNNKTCEILGYSREHLLKTSFQDITYQEDLDSDLERVAELIAGTKDSYDIEKRYVKGDGEIIWSNLTVAIVRLDNGDPDYFISVIEDITHRKSIELNQERLNNELKKTNEQLTRFAYSASHDMQEPLRKITSFSTSLLSRLGGSDLDDRSKFELERISNASRRMKNMIQRLLDLSRSAHVKLNLVKVSTEDLINDAQDQLSLAFRETNTKINVTGFDHVVCDRFVMSNVIENLIRNSIKYKAENRDPVIDICVEDNQYFSVISFTDNGIGFDNEFKFEIFEPFKRLVSNSEVDGTGMGLAICNQLVALHSGTISATGREGEGSVFTIKMPKAGALL